MAEKKYRVIQWATGGVGRAAIEGILLHPDLELVGCWVHSDSKNGVDVGEIIGTEPPALTDIAPLSQIYEHALARRLQSYLG